ncbi:hypothetical protein ACROYT_G017038 [Oculina patagonica]
MKPLGQTQLGTQRPINLLQLKSKTRIGCWNVRTLFQASKLAQLASELRRYGIAVLGVAEVRWNTFGEITTTTGETFLYSGKKNEEDVHENGVGLLIAKEAARRLEVKEQFYEQLQGAIGKVQRRDMLILMGDVNAKVGVGNSGREDIMGKEALGEINENGDMFIDFCAFNDLCIGGSFFQHRKIHKATWSSPDLRTHNQIDHITVSKKWKKTLLDVKVMRGADIDSDHHLVIGTFRMKLAAKRKVGVSGRKRFNTAKLRDMGVREEVTVTLRNKFEVLADIDEDDQDVDRMWQHCKNIFADTCKEVLGYRETTRKEWISENTWKGIEARREAKQKLNRETCMEKKRELQRVHKGKRREVRQKVKKDKKKWMDDLAQQAEEASAKHNTRELYNLTQYQCGIRMVNCCQRKMSK